MIAGAIALVALSPIIVPSIAGPAASVVSALLCGAALLVWAALDRGGATRVGRLARPEMMLLGATCVWLALASLMAAAPQVSWAGAIGQHAGSALWIAVAAWAALGLVYASKSHLRMALRTVSLVSALLALAAFIDAAGLDDRVQAWGSPAGLLENSLTLGQVLALGVACSVAWLMTEHAPGARAIAGAAALASAGGLVIAESRAALFGLAIGAVTALLMRAASRKPRGAVAFGVMSGMGIAAVVPGIWLIAGGSLGPETTARLNVLGTDRLTIWASALRSLAQDPWTGRGLDQFSAWVQWSFAGGGLSYNATYDPHDWVMALAIGGGALVVAVVAVTAGMLARSLATAFSNVGRPRFLIVLVAGIVSVPAAALLAWPSATAWGAAALLAGMVIGLGRTAPGGESATSPDSEARPPAAVRIVAVVLAAVLLGSSAPLLAPLAAEVQLASLDARRAPASEYLELAGTQSDPSFAARAIVAALAESAALADPTAVLSQAEETARRFDAESSYHVDLALQEIALYQSISLRTGRDTWPEFERAVMQGTLADPNSGIWEFLAALEADRLGRVDDATRYAREALEHDLDAEARAIVLEMSGR